MVLVVPVKPVVIASVVGGLKQPTIANFKLRGGLLYMWEKNKIEVYEM